VYPEPDHHGPQDGRQFDDLYDATDESDGGSSVGIAVDHQDSTVPNRTHDNGSGRRNNYPILFIPKSTDRDAFLTHKSSPVPPTPPPQIPISPAMLSRLPKIVPPVNDAPSLAGSYSASSAHPSSASAPPTPDLAAVSDTDWDDQRLRVYSDNEATKNSAPSSRSMSPQPDIQLETPEDWSHILNRFPRVVPEAEFDTAEAASDAESQPSASVVSSSKGVRLPNAALATLKGLDLDEMSSNRSSPSDVDELGQMCEIVRRPALRRRSTGQHLPPSHTASAASYTPLSVPSPGGFFASLGGDARRTWCFDNLNPPTSGTAENFYGRPWDAPGQTVVEHIIEVDEDDNATEGPPTAKAIIQSAPQTAKRLPPEAPETVSEEAPFTESLTQDVNELVEYDELYESELKVQASANFDRTSLWLAAQSAYLSVLAETNPMNKPDATRPTIGVVSGSELASITGSKKSVRFLDSVPEEPGRKDISLAAPKNAIFYRGFVHLRRNSKEQDTFRHSSFRFEATQTARISQIDKYPDQLAGKYELSSPVRPPYRGPFKLAPRNSTLPQILAEKDMFSKVEKEQDVLTQIQPAMWAIDALKYLNGGRLSPSPAADRLAKARMPLGSPETAGTRRRRVLDLGGHPACSWGWYTAGEYPCVKVYSVATKQQHVNPELKGPANHRSVSVPQLWHLPFGANQFDLISARNFHMLLKSIGSMDEYDLCLQECMRVLKPGGYLEFFVMDAEIARAGPYGSATSVEFGFNLKTRGYDPNPTRGFLSRVKKSGFINIKRAWIFLPMGTVPPEEDSPRSTSSPTGVSDAGSDSTGSTASIASTTGLFGGWMWEQWMLKMQTEMGRDKHEVLEETAAVVEEGRRSGAGWRCLSGWAMKPKKGGVVLRQPPPLPPCGPPR
jgi:U6 snRNA-associated Sm-like protein LSm2